MEAINWLAVLAAAVATFLIGGLWYSPLLFYKPWLRWSGGDEATLKKSTGLVFGGSFVAQVIAAAVLALFVAGQELVFAIAASAAVGAAWIATAFAVTYLFERRPFGLFAINAGYHLVSYIVMGLILGAWR